MLAAVSPVQAMQFNTPFLVPSPAALCRQTRACEGTGPCLYEATGAGDVAQITKYHLLLYLQ